MKLKLTNGEELEIILTPLILEYLEDYDGGIEGITNDINADRKLGYVANHFVYSLIASNLNHPIDYRQALNLVRFEDIGKLANFVIDNSESIKQTKESIKNKHF